MLISHQLAPHAFPDFPPLFPPSLCVASFALRASCSPGSFAGLLWTGRLPLAPADLLTVLSTQLSDEGLQVLHSLCFPAKKHSKGGD